MTVSFHRNVDGSGELQTFSCLWNADLEPTLPLKKFFLLFGITFPAAFGMYAWLNWYWTPTFHATGLAATAVLSLAVEIALGTLIYRSLKWLGKIKPKVRAIVFYRDGRIELPFGSPEVRDPRTYSGQPIASIEHINTRPYSTVNMYFTNGERVMIAADISTDNALRLTTLCNQARQELRQVQARPDLQAQPDKIIN